MLTGLVDKGLLYSIACSTHRLSNVSKIGPSGVMNVGTNAPDTCMLNVLSAKLPKLSVTLTTKVLVVFADSTAGAPVTNPAGKKVMPAGTDPLIN
jgi:hypothetical protein